MANEVRRYDTTLLGTDMPQCVVSATDYDALHAEAEALRANIARLTSNPADHRYWEGRYRDVEAELEAARGLLEKARLHLRDSGHNLAADDIGRHLAENATPAPEVPDHLRDSAKMVEQGEQQRDDEERHEEVKEIHDVMAAVPCASLYSLAEAVLDAGYMKADQQGERQEAVAWSLRLPDGRTTLEKAYPKWAEGEGDGYAIQPLYTSPPPAQDVAPLASALYQACGAYDMPERVLDVLSAAANGEPFAHMIDGILPCVPDQDISGLLEALKEAAAELEDWRMSFPDANATVTDGLLVRIDNLISAHRNPATVKRCPTCTGTCAEICAKARP